MAEWLNAADVRAVTLVPLTISNGEVIRYFNVKPPTSVYVGPNPTLSTNGAEANGYKHFI